MDSPNELALIAQFDYQGTFITDFTSQVSVDGQLDDPATFVKRINALMLEMSGDAPRIIVP